MNEAERLVELIPRLRRYARALVGDRASADDLVQVGGRLLPGESGPVAQFMYQCNAGTRVTLYVRSEATQNRETAFRYAKEGNVRVFYWVDRKLGYALSTSDISKDDLLKVSTAVYQQLNP